MHLLVVLAQQCLANLSMVLLCVAAELSKGFVGMVVLYTIVLSSYKFTASAWAYNQYVCLQFSLQEINMNLALEENGIKDGLSVEEMGLTTSYCPVLCLYWCDDLTIA